MFPAPRIEITSIFELSTIFSIDLPSISFFFEQLIFSNKICELTPIIGLFSGRINI